MKKMAILSVMLLLAFGAVTAVVTYSGATVTSPVEIRIVATGEALLALMGPEDEASVEYCTVNGGNLTLNFNRPGFTPDSRYEFDKLFVTAHPKICSLTT